MSESESKGPVSESLDLVVFSSFPFWRLFGHMFSSELIVKSSNPTNYPVLLQSTIPSFAIISSQWIPLTPLQPCLFISCTMNAKFWSDIGFVVQAACLYCLTVSQVGMGRMLLITSYPFWWHLLAIKQLHLMTRGWYLIPLGCGFLLPFVKFICLENPSSWRWREWNKGIYGSTSGIITKQLLFRTVQYKVTCPKCERSVI